MRRNILITSAGRRGKLVEIFQRELAATLPGGVVYAADAQPELSAACKIAERSFAVPRVDDPGYIECLGALCDAHDIGLVVPTIDTELAVLAEHREVLAERGIAVVVCDPDLVCIFRDKRATVPWFESHGLRTPRMLNPRAAAKFPMFAKPCDGSCSHGARIIVSAGEITPALLSDRRMMFTEYFSPAEHDEYTLDAYFDRHGQLRCLVPRWRLETRAGEVSKGVTRRVPVLTALCENFAFVAGARGCLTMQVFVHRQSQSVYGIEVNPRFGGGYPLTYEAGANFPRWLVQEYLQGQTIEFFDGWESNLTMLRYDDHVVVRGTAA